MFRIKVWAPTLASWMAISFTICVLGSLIVQGLPINHEGLELFLPGFTWISWGSYVLGTVGDRCTARLRQFCSFCSTTFPRRALDLTVA